MFDALRTHADTLKAGEPLDGIMDALPGKTVKLPPPEKLRAALALLYRSVVKDTVPDPFAGSTNAPVPSD